MPTITTKDGVEIFYKDWGSGQPIVFSHGWPLSADDWDAQMLFFAGQGFRVIAHDRRGHGRSSQVSDGHDMDHYADEQDELYQALNNKSIHRNFMGYTTRADTHQIGFGVSSISYVGGNYFQNAKKIDDYMNQISTVGFATYRGYILSTEDKIRRDLITELMCHRGVDKIAFGKSHNIDFNTHFADDLKCLSNFEEDHLLTQTADEIRINDQGLLVMRNMAMCFDEHLDAIRKNARNPVFSRTV